MKDLIEFYDEEKIEFKRKTTDDLWEVGKKSPKE